MQKEKVHFMKKLGAEAYTKKPVLSGHSKIDKTKALIYA